MNQTMMLAKAYAGEQQIPTFKLVPLSKDCAYVGGIYNPINNFLLLYLREKEQTYMLLEKLDDNGKPQYIKGTQEVKAERRSIEEFYKVSIEDAEDVKFFIENMCINWDTFEYHQYLSKIEIGAKMEKPSLILQP